MLWNVQFIGKPDAIKRALESYGSSIDGVALESFSKARPVLERLMDLNESNTGSLSLSAFASDDGTALSVVMMQSNALHVV